MCEIDWAALCEETAQYIDLDSRFWDQDEGAFEWGGHRVFFRKLRGDAIELTVGSETRVCGRN